MTTCGTLTRSGRPGRATFADRETSYLYDPNQVVETGIAKLTSDMRKHKLAQRAQKDTGIWQTICLTLHQHFQGDIQRLLMEGKYNAPRILNLIRSKRYRFPYLKGDKIGPLWLRMLQDSWQGRQFTGMEELPIAVDVHIAAGTVMTGCVRGSFEGTFKELREAIVQVWFDACRDREYYPLQFDEPLWHLSRRGCRDTPLFPCVHRASCPVAEFCTSTSVQMDYGAASGIKPVRFVAWGK